MPQYNHQDLIGLFNHLFMHTEQTVLVAGSAEPVYLPPDQDCAFHRIIFTQDYYASALHEVAHWCIAGKQRRQRIDYGYWYNPDGRDAEQQQLFQLAEVKPQALEWIFSAAAGIKFHLSQDNLSANHTADNRFADDVYQQAYTYLINGLPARAEKFKQALLDFYVGDSTKNITLRLEDIMIQNIL